jgi:hypothetical protein
MQVTPPTTTDDERLILNLTELRDAGVLSEEEFEAKRRGVTREGGTDPTAADSSASSSDGKTGPC